MSMIYSTTHCPTYCLMLYPLLLQHPMLHPLPCHSPTHCLARETKWSQGLSKQ